MPLNLRKPITYLITSGATTAATSPSTEDFSRLLQLVQAAVAARIDLIQLREKDLHAHVLYELASRAAAITRDSSTRLLINDRADIAQAAGAAGVHLTANSLPTSVVRHAFPDHFLIGVSTHSEADARDARNSGADFAVFGPVFATTSKARYGEPVGPTLLNDVAVALAPFPIIALGGVTIGNARECLRTGAAGVAAIRMFGDPQSLKHVVATIRESPVNEQRDATTS